jgi:PleD family two-component response regulator
VEAQDITGKQIRATLPKFETSKAFADFIKYKSQRESSAMKSNVVAEKTSNSIFRISKYEKNNKKIYREPSSNSFQSIRKTLSTLGSKSILIVESSTLTAKILIYHLQQKFNLVVHAVSDKEALSSLLSDTVFEWILFSIDISSDCLSLIAKYTDYCKKHNSTPAKVIGVASDTKSPLVPYALAAGFKTVLMIPFDHNDFMAAIHKAQSEGRSRFLHGTQQGDLEAAAVNS